MISTRSSNDNEVAVAVDLISSSIVLLALFIVVALRTLLDPLTKICTGLSTVMPGLSWVGRAVPIETEPVTFIDPLVETTPKN